MSSQRLLRLVLGHAILVGFLFGLLLGNWNGARTGRGFAAGSWLLLLVTLLFAAAGILLYKLLKDALAESEGASDSDRETASTTRGTTTSTVASTAENPVESTAASAAGEEAEG